MLMMIQLLFIDFFLKIKPSITNETSPVKSNRDSKNKKLRYTFVFSLYSLLVSNYLLPFLSIFLEVSLFSLSFLLEKLSECCWNRWFQLKIRIKLSRKSVCVCVFVCISVCVCAATLGSCFSSLGADRMPGQRYNRYRTPTNPALLQASLLLSLREQWRSDRFVFLHVFNFYLYVCARYAAPVPIPSTPIFIYVGN